MTGKRKGRNSSTENSGDVNKPKAKVSKQRGPSADTADTVVSDILCKANAVLYDQNDSTSTSDTSVFVTETETGAEQVEGEGEGEGKMAEGGQMPTNQDLMKCMETLGTRLSTIEEKLKGIETLETKVTNFEQELNKVWLALNKRATEASERVDKLEERADGADIEAGLISDRVSRLEEQRDKLVDEVAYLKSQSMRNNLIFTNIEEDNSDGNESAEVTEGKLRKHLHDNLKIAKEIADNIRLERVHRTPAQPVDGKVRSVVAKFTFFKDREMVRKQWPKLESTTYRVFEQFPPEVVEKRRKLVPKLKAAKAEKKRAWIAYDTLYIDGKPVKPAKE